MRERYYIIVLNNHSVLYTLDINHFDQNNVKFIIKCEFQGKTASGMHLYYKHTLLNQLQEPIVDNRFTWDGMPCKLHPNESWRDFNDKKFSTICLSIDITDKLGRLRTIQFRNENHTLDSYKIIVNHLDTLARVGTHQAVKEIQALNEKITVLSDKLKV
jgi:hypothetical protein